MDHRASVAGLLGSAAGAAEALTDCGIDTDDTELVANYVEAMAQVHREFVEHIASTKAQLREGGATENDLNDDQTCLRLSMSQAPAFTNPWFLWRLSIAVKAMASAEVLKAAREVVTAHRNMPGLDVPFGYADVQKAIGQLQAVLPKEAE